jgi:hypothetical protein
VKLIFKKQKPMTDRLNVAIAEAEIKDGKVVEAIELDEVEFRMLCYETGRDWYGAASKMYSGIPIVVVCHR